MRRGRVQSVIVVLATTVAVAAVVSVDGGVWRRIQRAFVGEQTDQAPEWLEPAPGTSAVPQPVRFRWTSVRGAVAYRLHVGTAPGRQNLVSTGRIQSKSYTTPQLPGGRPLYARVSARRDGAWHHADLRFTARRLGRDLDHPRPGQPDVEPARLFEWTPVPEADTYHLTVGTRPGLSDVIDLPLRETTQIRLEGLPVGRRLAAACGRESGASGTRGISTSPSGLATRRRVRYTLRGRWWTSGGLSSGPHHRWQVAIGYASAHRPAGLSFTIAVRSMSLGGLLQRSRKARDSTRPSRRCI